MKTAIMKIVSSIAIAGEVLAPGALVELTMPEARDLLRRGKAELHDQSAQLDAEPEPAGEAPADAPASDPAPAEEVPRQQRAGRGRRAG